MENEGSGKQGAESSPPEAEEPQQANAQEGPPEGEQPEASSDPLDVLQIGEGVQEPVSGGRQPEFERIEPGPTEVVSFASNRYPAESDEGPDTETKREIPWMRVLQVGAIVLVNLIVLGVAAYVVYRGMKRTPQQQEQPEGGRLMAPDAAAVEFVRRGSPAAP